MRMRRKSGSDGNLKAAAAKAQCALAVADLRSEAGCQRRSSDSLQRTCYKITDCTSPGQTGLAMHQPRAVPLHGGMQNQASELLGFWHGCCLQSSNRRNVYE
jgi:hypothetical protein